MHFACMEVSTVQVLWSSFQQANSGLHISKISTYPALKLIAQQFKFSRRCHSFQTNKRKHAPHKTKKKLTSRHPHVSFMARWLRPSHYARATMRVHNSIATHASCHLDPMSCQLVKLSHPSQHHKRKNSARGLAFLASAQSISKIQYICMYVNSCNIITITASQNNSADPPDARSLPGKDHLLQRMQACLES